MERARGMRDFRELKVWQKAIGLFEEVVRDVEKFPNTRAAKVIEDQVLRSVGSISANIAEGYNKLSDLEFSKYLNNSETSLEEVMSCLDLILDDGHITKEKFEEILRKAEESGAQLIASGKKVRREGTRL